MLKLLRPTLLAALAAALLALPAAPADEKKDTKDKDEPKVEKKEEKNAEPTKEVKKAEEGARSIEAIVTAYGLIDFGRAGDEKEQAAVKLTRAEALVLAARILKQNPVEMLKDVPEGAKKAEPVDQVKLIDGLLKYARELAKGDPIMAELIDRVKEGARGGVGGPRMWDMVTMLPGAKLTYNKSYTPGAPAQITMLVQLGSPPWGGPGPLVAVSGGFDVQIISGGKLVARGTGQVTYNVPAGKAAVPLTIIITNPAGTRVVGMLTN